MTSVTLPRRAHNLHLLRNHRSNQSYNTDDEDTNDRIKHNYQYFPMRSKISTTTRALSYEEPEIQSSATNNNRITHLCSRLKRHFSLKKEHRTHSEDNNETTSERRINRFKDYKSFSSSTEDPFDDFEWPDFEKVYESIPPCLINALPGLDDLSTTENCSSSPLNQFHYEPNETNDYSNEQMHLFLQCKRGKDFRRNALCHKLDKSQYNAQLDTFVRQLMIEKLMRTWT